MAWNQHKKITVINIHTGETITFQSQVEFCRSIGARADTVSRWVRTKKLLKGIWKLKTQAQKGVDKHIHFLVQSKGYRQCVGCKATLSPEVVICPICGYKQHTI